MTFRFHGTIEELIDTIQSNASAQKKDIIIFHNNPDILEIGFQRLGSTE